MVSRFSPWVDTPTRHHLKRSQTRHEEIVATPQFDEVGQVRTDERRILRIRCTLHDEFAFAAVIPDNQIFVVSLVQIVSIFDPLLLHEFELAEQACVQSHKNDAAIILVTNRLALRYILAVGEAAAHDAPAIDEFAVETKGIARVCAADVRAYGACLLYTSDAADE